ncbi:hypothetical protein SDC9_03369 [bioreactor metagenome]|jgi:hypothetical protein|uniref:Uncharacterized protein n=2 Tax=root TaxID=1 RepID=A0AB33HU39_9CHLR|nr:MULTISPECIES: hypothetical protein [Dehalococcoides]MBF4482874.1 hypothetical protein [Dehalococcoides mccartyi]MBJ7532126.1 hypothetical protein [Dehalococcoides mccartyi]MDN4185705.1 hypothetical protein [Dehalococcoides mccartyi]MEA4879296.1 hypothetical protein [Dehalococcoides mccartyi]POZ58897.1 hypothetical protein C1O63_1233 [Dehalococcoides mccartyi]
MKVTINACPKCKKERVIRIEDENNLYEYRERYVHQDCAKCLAKEMESKAVGATA